MWSRLSASISNEKFTAHRYPLGHLMGFSITAGSFAVRTRPLPNPCSHVWAPRWMIARSREPRHRRPVGGGERESTARAGRCPLVDLPGPRRPVSATSDARALIEITIESRERDDDNRMHQEGGLGGGMGR